MSGDGRPPRDAAFSAIQGKTLTTGEINASTINTLELFVNGVPIRDLFKTDVHFPLGSSPHLDTTVQPSLMNSSFLTVPEQNIEVVTRSAHAHTSDVAHSVYDPVNARKGNVMMSDEDGHSGWQPLPSSGDVNGPLQSRLDSIAVFDSKQGTLLRDSSATIQGDVLTVPEMRVDRLHLSGGRAGDTLVQDEKGDLTWKTPPPTLAMVMAPPPPPPAPPSIEVSGSPQGKVLPVYVLDSTVSPPTLYSTDVQIHQGQHLQCDTLLTNNTTTEEMVSKTLSSDHALLKEVTASKASFLQLSLPQLSQKENSGGVLSCDVDGNVILIPPAMVMAPSTPPASTESLIDNDTPEPILSGTVPQFSGDDHLTRSTVLVEPDGTLCVDRLRVRCESSMITGADAMDVLSIYKNNIQLGTGILNPGSDNLVVGHGSSVKEGVHHSILLGNGVQSTQSGQLALGSSLSPLITSEYASAGNLSSLNPVAYLPITINGIDYKLALYGT
jgi:hypothetical protein